MRIVLLVLIAFSYSNFIYPQELPLYKKTEHFEMMCLPTEHDAADDLLNQSEIFFEQLSEDLDHDYSCPITIKMYANTQALSQAVDGIVSLDEMVIPLAQHTCALVNPDSAQRNDFYDSFLKAINLQLAHLFIEDKYPHHDDIPYWLKHGLALYLSHYISDETIEAFKKSGTTLTTLQELESFGKEDKQDFAQVNGCMASYLLVEFIDTAWNRENLLALLDNYGNFENILRYLKKDVEKHWAYYTFFTTHAFKSGDASLIPFMKDLLITFKKALSVPHKKRIVPELEDILSSFIDYRTKMIESDNHVLIIIQDNKAVTGWALFSLESESRATLEGLCIHPHYRHQDIGKKLINAVHQNFRHIKSITTVNRTMNLKTPYFCGTFDVKKIEN